MTPDPDQLLLDGRTLGEADAAQVWHRVDLGDGGRALTTSPGNACAEVVTVTARGYAYTRRGDSGEMVTARGCSWFELAGRLLVDGLVVRWRGWVGAWSVPWLR